MYIVNILFFTFDTVSLNSLTSIYKEFLYNSIPKIYNKYISGYRFLTNIQLKNHNF